MTTCFGARVTKSSDKGSWIKEILSATGFHDSDLAPAGPQSLTRCLAQALESSVGDQTPTVYNLHHDRSAMRNYSPEPYHGWLSGSPTFGSIRLLPVQTPLAELAAGNPTTGPAVIIPPKAEVLVRVNLMTHRLPRAIWRSGRPG
jgi:hypothetical protein